MGRTQGAQARGGDGFEPDPRLAPYDYILPPEQIARFPAAEREDARLMDLRGEGPVHRVVRDLPALLDPGDLLVVNDTRVMRARLRLVRESGGRVEALLLGPGPGPVPALMRPGGRLKPGERLRLEQHAPELPGAGVRLISRDEQGDWTVEVSPSPAEVMAAVGHVPLPPYLGRDDVEEDRVRYQTVYAAEPGAVAAPTAGLHLGEKALAQLAARGVGVARLTLHVGVGTFRNLRSEDLDSGLLHEERYWIPEETSRRVAATRSSGRRVVAVGTTSARALESSVDEAGAVRAGAGATRLFVREGYRFKVVDGLLTNFHLPRSSLLMLIAAFGGQDRVLSAYRDAVSAGYRFFSYGDAMLLFPGGEAA